MEAPLQHECTVSGTLGFVLRVSQVYGVAALKLERAGDGWRIRVSQSTNLRGIITVLLMCIITSISLTLDFRLDDELLLQARTSTDTALSISTVFMITAVLAVAAYTGVNRMQHIITCFTQLQEINAELSQYSPYISFEKIQRRIAVCSLISGHIIIIVDYCINYYNIIHKQGNLFSHGIYIAYHVEVAMLKVLIVQVSVILTTVLLSFNHLNGCLTKLLRQINKESNVISRKNNQRNEDSNISYKTISNTIDCMGVYGDTTTESPNSVPATLHHLSYMYCSLCDVVQDMDNHHGIVLVSMMLYFLLHLIITIYNLVARLFGNMADQIISVTQIPWIAYHASDLIIIVDPCHRTHMQMYRTKHLISQMIRSISPDQYTLMSELQLFYKHLMMNGVVYAPMRMFNLNRTVLATILGSITTYLVVVVQL